MTVACPGPMSGWKRTPSSHCAGASALGLSSQLPTERTQTCAHGGDHRRCGSCRPEPVDEPRVVLEAAGDEDDVVRRRFGHLMVGNRADEVCAQALDSVRQPGGDRLPEVARADGQKYACGRPSTCAPATTSSAATTPLNVPPSSTKRTSATSSLSPRRRPPRTRASSTACWSPAAACIPSGRSVPTATGAPRAAGHRRVGCLGSSRWAAAVRGRRAAASLRAALGERGDALHHRLPRGRRLDRAPSMREADETTAPAASSRASCGGMGVQVQLPLSRRPLRAVVSASEQRDSPARQADVLSRRACSREGRGLAARGRSSYAQT